MLERTILLSTGCWAVKLKQEKFISAKKKMKKSARYWLCLGNRRDFFLLGSGG
jgi:hypothetical protein